MNALSKFRSRAVRLGVVLVVAQQLQDINMDVTPYAVARALDCSHVTARKYLRELVAVGQMEKEVKAFPHCTKELFSVTEEPDKQLRTSVSNYLNQYHIGRLQS